MTKQEDTRRKSRRDLLLILLILPFGILCMFITGQSAIKLAPTWLLPANMFSNLDPNADFAGLDIPQYIEPLNPGILTQQPNEFFSNPIVIVISTPAPVRTPQPPPVINTPDDIPPPTATQVGPPFLPTQSVPHLADLAITKTDNSNTYTPGTSINYTLVVTNNGPGDAYRFNIVDNIPAVVSGLTVNCAPIASCGTNTSSGNTVSITNASLNTGNQLSITVNGLVASGATGNLSNSAEVSVPPRSGYRDPIDVNNVATDTDTQLSVYDVAIIKNDLIDTFTAATTQFNYTVEITNSGPSDAIGITINDAIPAGIASWSWTCLTVNSTCNGTPINTSNFTDVVTIQSGGSIQYAVTANLAPIMPPQNPQNISNTASLVIPSGPGVIVEQSPTNNSDMDINVPYIDLQITKDDGVSEYTQGGSLSYTVTVGNNSSFDLNGITVTDNMPALIDSWSWTCLPDSATPPVPTCSSGPSATNINDTAVTLPAGRAVIYTINATVNSTAIGGLTNTADVLPPFGLVDAVPGNNTAEDTDTRLFEYTVLGPPDGIIIGPTSGSWFDYTLTTPITINGNTSDYEIVFYERGLANNTIELDQVIISISNDLTTWYTVYYWGDNLVDTNASPPGSTSEPDNYSIPTSLLYGSPFQTGILIDADGGIGAPPNGTYQYIRVTAPLGDADNGCDIDTIGVWP